MVTVSLLEVFHLAKHHKLFFVNNLLRCLLEHVILLKLLVLKSDLPLIFLSVETDLKSINFTLVFVDGFGKCLDCGSLFLDNTLVFANPPFKGFSI